MKIAMLIVMFFCVGAFFIISQANLHLNSSENADKFISLYTAWLGQTFESAVSLTGHIVKMEWLPKN